MGLLRCALNDQTRLAVFTNEKGLSLKNNPLHGQKHRLVEIVVVEDYKSLADFFLKFVRVIIYCFVDFLIFTMAEAKSSISFLEPSNACCMIQTASW